MAMLITGTVLITMSSQVKLPSLLALGFVAVALARRWGGTFKAFLLAGGSLGALSLAVMAVIGWASGLGFGWLFTLGTANVVRSWMSPPTLLALGTGQVGILLGLGDHTTAVLALTRGIGVSIIAVLVTWLLWAVLRGRLHPVGGLGWRSAPPCCCSRWFSRGTCCGPSSRWRRGPPGRDSAAPTIAITLVVGIFGPTANGDRFALFQIVMANVASTVIVLLLIALTYYRLPWRRLPDAGPEEEGALAPAPGALSRHYRNAGCKPGAYAESP